MAFRLDQVSDDWYESEAQTRIGMIAELQRFKRRMRARPIPVIALAAVITTGIVYVAAVHRRPVEAEVVLALTEGSLTMKHHDLPLDDLRQYVDGVLITDSKLADLIEKRNLYPLRKKLGKEYAIEELRSQITIEIWKNSFVYYDADADNAEHSARIGITVADIDPDRAYELAHDLANIVIETSQEHRKQLDSVLAQEIAATRDALTQRVNDLTQEAAEKQTALVTAHKLHREDLAQALDLELAEISSEQQAAEKRLAEIAGSRDALADRIASAGLDTQIAVVEEHRPERPEHPELVLVIVALVIGVCSLIGAAMLIGAFDSRVHDAEDVTRLGLPMLGHVPGFQGDHVGSLASRSASGARVPSWARWRSHR